MRTEYKLSPSRERTHLRVPQTTGRWRSGLGRHIKVLVISVSSLCVAQTLNMGESIANPGESASPEQLSTSMTMNKNTSVEQRVAKTVSTILAESPMARVSNRPDRIGPALILKLDLPLYGESAQQRAEDFINRYSELWGSLSVHIDRVETRRGRSVAHLSGDIAGVPLMNQQSKLSIKGSRAQHLSNGMGAIHQLIKANIDEKAAQDFALKTLNIQGLTPLSVKRGAVSYEPGIAHEVFEVRIAQPALLKTWVVLIDGRDGAILRVSEGEKH